MRMDVEIYQHGLHLGLQTSYPVSLRTSPLTAREAHVLLVTLIVVTIRLFNSHEPSHAALETLRAETTSEAATENASHVCVSCPIREGSEDRPHMGPRASPHGG